MNPAVDARAVVLVVDPIDPWAIAELSRRADIVEEVRPSPERFLALAANADAIVLRSGVRLGVDVLDAAPRLRVIARAGVGLDNIDVASARRRGVIVFNVPGESTISVAEHTIALVLALARNIPRADAYLRRGSWPKAQLAGIELNGKQLGIVGAGAIGRRVAKLARGLGMMTVGCISSPTPERDRQLAQEGIAPATLDDLMATSDVVSVHVPLDSSTVGLIGAREIALVRPGGLLVNLARGGVVDEQAVCRALDDAHLGGYAADVFGREAGTVELAQYDRTVLTPHIGAMTYEAQRRVSVVLVDSLVAALTGDDVSNVGESDRP